MQKLSLWCKTAKNCEKRCHGQLGTLLQKSDVEHPLFKRSPQCGASFSETVGTVVQ